jgi:carboxymethylenebutenolidase
VIGFYGWPVGGHRTGLPAPVDEAARFTCPVLAIWAGADEGIGPGAVAAFEAAMEEAGVVYRSLVYRDAPHSFFDRAAREHREAAADAWRRVLEFVELSPAAGACVLGGGR